jgi:hypothetical protein
LKASDASVDETRAEVVPKPLFLWQREIHFREECLELCVESREVCEAT